MRTILLCALAAMPLFSFAQSELPLNGDGADSAFQFRGTQFRGNHLRESMEPKKDAFEFKGTAFRGNKLREYTASSAHKPVQEKAEEKQPPQKSIGEPQHSAVSAWPNPFTEELILGYSLDKDAEVEILLTDVLGKQLPLLKQQQQAGRHELPISKSRLDLSRGMYILKLVIGQNTSYIKIILK